MSVRGGELGLDENLNIALLLDIYSPILTERQAECTTLYYNEDLSLSEIAEITGITRQGVRDCIRKSVAHMNELEDRLLLLKRRGANEARLRGIISRLTKLTKDNPELARTLTECEALLREL